MSLQSVEERVRSAAIRSGRRREDITLVVVTKGRSVEQIQGLYRAGHRHFGENRAQELAAKVGLLPPDIQWHFVGPLQTNKVRIVRPVVMMLHSLDREDLARAWLKGPGLAPPALLQVNIGREPQKHGFEPNQVIEAFSGLIDLGVRLQGLMAIPPLGASPEEARPYLHRLARLSSDIRRLYPDAGEISMGMTDDFEVAVEEGATFIRVGRAIFDVTGD
jgi:pyridoxal phosphate enzyme (YggS family)